MRSPPDLNRSLERARHHRHGVSGHPATCSADDDRRKRAPGRRVQDDLGRRSGTGHFRGQVESDPIRLTLESYAVRSCRQIRRRAEQFLFRNFGRGAVGGHAPGAFELQPDADHSLARGGARACKKRQVEARVARASVEVQPLGPGAARAGTSGIGWKRSIARRTDSPSGCVHERSAGVSVHVAMSRVSESPSARSRLGIPPRARMGMVPRLSIR